MKLRAITLAAAGLLAAASAQAELQTWRYSGLLMGHWEDAPSRGGANAPPQQLQFDLTFDTAATASGNSFDMALRHAVIDGLGHWIPESSLVAGTPESYLHAIVDGGNMPALQLEMIVLAPWSTESTGRRPIASVGEFLTTTDQLIDEIHRVFVEGDGYTWQELVNSPAMETLFPKIGLGSAWSGQTYALIGAHNITPGVPEPSAWTLALLGGVGAAAVARRRQPTRQAEALAA